MRKELIDKIMMYLMGIGINDSSISQELMIILSNYEITARETAITVRHEDKNNYFLQKFMIAKTVKGCTDRTLQYYRTTIVSVLSKIGKPADEITSDDIRLYLAVRQKRDNVTKTTVKNEYRCLSSFYGFLYSDELIRRNPILKIEPIKCEKKKKTAFTEMEVEKMRAVCINSWEAAVVEVFLSTGCRVTELVNMKIEDLKGDELVVHGKGNKDRSVYLNAKAIIAIEKYLSERKDSNPYMFPGGHFGVPEKDPINWYKYPERVDKSRPTVIRTVEVKIQNIGKRANVKEVHPHRFRRTCATFALRRGMPIEYVSKMLGHEQISTTQIYLDLSEEDLKQSHKKYVV
jgi:site-specific recombinase XerD